jgi:replicative DNA helicase
LIIEVFPNPDLVTISANIKKHVLQDDVKYVFYDYIHITSGLVQDRDKQMRDDVILMLLSSTLKELANELDIHISTATQLNGKRRNCHNTFLPVITGVHIY